MSRPTAPSNLIRTLAVILLTLACLHTLSWFIGAHLLRSQLQESVVQLRQQGWAAGYDINKARLGGFPFRISANLPDVFFAPAPREGEYPDWIFSAPMLRVSLSALPWAFDQIAVDLSRPHTFQTGWTTYAGKADLANLRINLSNGLLPDQIQVHAQNWHFESDSLPKETLKIEQVSFNARFENETTYPFDLKIQNITHSHGLLALGRFGEEILLRGTLNGALNGGSSPREIWQNWRDHGGTVTLDRTQFLFGSLFLQGHGTVSLDADLQPVGDLHTQIRGAFGIIDNLQGDGLMSPHAATTAKVFLGQLMNRSNTPIGPTLDLRLSLQHQTLYAGPIALLKIPTLIW